MKPNRELTDQQKLFLEKLFSEAEGDPKIAGDLAGYAPGAYTGAVRGLKDEIIDLAKQYLATHSVRAARKLVNAMDDGATELGAAIKLQAAEKILDRVGITKKEQIEVNGETFNAIFLIPAKTPLKTDEEKAPE